MSKGIIQIPSEHIITSTWKEKNDLIKWALANYAPKDWEKDVTNSYKMQVDKNPLALWIDTYIVEKRISFTSNLVLTPHPIVELRKLLAKRKIDLLTWRQLVILYMNQFFAKVLPGRGGSMSVMYKYLDNDNLMKPLYMPFRDLRKFFALERRFRPEEMEGDEDEDDYGLADLEEEIELRPRAEKNKKRKRGDQEKRKKKKHKKHHHHKRVKTEPTSDEPIDVSINPLRAAVNNITTRSRQRKELPPILPEAEEEEEGDDPADGDEEEGGTKKKKRVRVYAASLFEKASAPLVPFYEIVSSRPSGDMFGFYDEKAKKHKLVNNASMIMDEGHELIRTFFKMHNSTYKVSMPTELNIWTPFAIRFNHDEVQKICKGQVGKAAWDAGLKESCDEANIVWNHFYAVLCDKNEESFKTLITYFASLIQRPWEHSNITINHQGPQGIGKSEVTIFHLKIYIFFFNL